MQRAHGCGLRALHDPRSGASGAVNGMVMRLREAGEGFIGAACRERVVVHGSVAMKLAQRQGPLPRPFVLVRATPVGGSVGREAGCNGHAGPVVIRSCGVGGGRHRAQILATASTTTAVDGDARGVMSSSPLPRQRELPLCARRSTGCAGPGRHLTRSESVPRISLVTPGTRRPSPRSGTRPRPRCARAGRRAPPLVSRRRTRGGG